MALVRRACGWCGQQQLLAAAVLALAEGATLITFCKNKPRAAANMSTAGLTVQSWNLLISSWSGFEAAKTAPWPSRGIHHCGKFLEPSDE